MLNRAGYVVLEAGTGEQALRVVRTERPDLIIVGILMPTIDGYTIARELRDALTTADVPVVFCTATEANEDVRLLAGAGPVSSIDDGANELQSIIELFNESTSASRDALTPAHSEAVHHEHFRALNAELMQKLEELREALLLAGALHQRSGRIDDDAASESPFPSPSALEPGLRLLSPRELQVLAIIAEGAPNSQIANRLMIADTTVQSHVKHILRKLGVKNRTQAAARYLHC